MYSWGVKIVPRTAGSKYSDTEDLSGNWAGLIMVISALPYSWKTNKNQLTDFILQAEWITYLGKRVKYSTGKG